MCVHKTLFESGNCTLAINVTSKSHSCPITFQKDRVFVSYSSIRVGEPWHQICDVALTFSIDSTSNGRTITFE